MKYWQVAAGWEGRGYCEEFLKYGIAFFGADKYNSSVVNRIKEGDCIILKRGKSEIIAAGITVKRNGQHTGDARKEEGREWLLDFDGWTLPLYLNVEWHKPLKPLAVKGLTRGTICAVNKPPPLSVADTIITTTTALSILPEPIPVTPLSDDDMLKHLIKLGLRPSTADELTLTLNRIRLLADYYYHNSHWEDIREHETRTFLIIPFLLALGWSEQQLKIELSVVGGRVDIACFKRAYKRDHEHKPNDNDCTIILESKGFSQGLDYAHDQGKLYAKHFPNCQVVVTSNGYCYKAYERKNDKEDFEDEPTAYLNLLRPKQKYPRDPSINGSLRLLEYLIPQNWTVG